jgi:hypothetical protein
MPNPIDWRDNIRGSGLLLLSAEKLADLASRSVDDLGEFRPIHAGAGLEATANLRERGGTNGERRTFQSMRGFAKRGAGGFAELRRQHVEALDVEAQQFVPQFLITFDLAVEMQDVENRRRRRVGTGSIRAVSGTADSILRRMIAHDNRLSLVGTLDFMSIIVPMVETAKALTPSWNNGFWSVNDVL